MRHFVGVRNLAVAFAAFTWAALLQGAPSLSLPDAPRFSASPAGGDMRYTQLRSDDRSVNAFSVPVILPLEANLGRLSLGSTMEYVRKEYRDEVDSRTVEGPGYFSLDGRFRAFESGRYRLEFLESVNVPVSREREQNLPPEAWLSTGGYVLDSGLNFSYLAQRTQVSLGLQHSWKLPHRDYNPGESIRASVVFGFGFGQVGASALADRWPVALTVGVTSYYTYADRLNREILVDSERGAVYFAPGITYSGSSLNLWADVEIPFHQLRATEAGFEERLRGRIGLRYFYR